jgi:hypothetical protein
MTTTTAAAAAAAVNLQPASESTLALAQEAAEMHAQWERLHKRGLLP